MTCCVDVAHVTLTEKDVYENETVTCGVLAIVTFAWIWTENDDVNDEIWTSIVFLILILIVSDVLSGIDANVIYVNESEIDFFDLGLTQLKSMVVLH